MIGLPVSPLTTKMRGEFGNHFRFHQGGIQGLGQTWYDRVALSFFCQLQNHLMGASTWRHIIKRHTTLPTNRLMPILIGSLLTSLTGCFSPYSLEKAVVAYDYAITNTLVEQLLVNIARAHHHQPIHFTAVSNIAATFDFRAFVGATPPLGGVDGGFSLAPLFGTSMAENPTISISPIDGEDFTQRLLTPLQETKLTLLLRQGVDIDLLLRLMAGELRIFRGEGEIAYYNSPSDKVGYPLFRRTVLHLSHLQDTNQLYVEPLVLEREWSIPFSTLSGEDFATLEQSYQVTYDSTTNQYVLKKHVVGRIVITNYDPDLLSPEERLDLQKKAERWPPNDLLVDIRPGFPGGELPIQGDFRLRSFHAILNFLGRTMEEEPEYHVDPDPLTGSVKENPVRTFDIIETSSPPKQAILSAPFQGEYYSFTDQPNDSWNQEAFRLLYQLFQMTVTEELKGAAAPSITIAK